MEIEIIRQLVENKRYQVKLQALQHAIKEGFGEKDIIEAILSGHIIETYQERQRVLICGQATIGPDTVVYLHVVCEQNYIDQVEFVTAYIPDEHEWGKLPFRRRRRK